MGLLLYRDYSKKPHTDDHPWRKGESKDCLKGYTFLHVFNFLNSSIKKNKKLLAKSSLDSHAKEIPLKLKSEKEEDRWKLWLYKHKYIV